MSFDLEEGEKIVLEIKKSEAAYWLHLFGARPSWVWRTRGAILVGLLVVLLVSLAVARQFAIYFGYALAIAILLTALVSARDIWIFYVKHPITLWRNDRHFVTNRRYIYQDGGEFHGIPLSMIQNTTVISRGLWANIFNYADWVVSAPQIQLTAELKDINTPRDVRRALFRQLEESQATSQTPLDALRLVFHKRMDTAKRDITILWRRHWIFLLMSLTPAVLLGVVGLGIAKLVLTLDSTTAIFSPSIQSWLPIALPLGLTIPFMWWQFTSWRNKVLILDEERLQQIEKRPLGLSYSKREIPLKSLVGATCELPGRLADQFGWGTVIITMRTPRTPMIRVDQMPSPMRIKAALNAAAIDIWQTRMTIAAHTALESRNEVAYAYGKNLLLQELTSRTLEEHQYEDWVAQGTSRRSPLDPPPPIEIAQIPNLGAAQVPDTLTSAVVTQVAPILEKLDLLEAFLRLAGFSEQGWARLVTVAAAWQRGSKITTSESLCEIANCIIGILLETLGVSPLNSMAPAEHLPLCYTSVLDVGQIFAGMQSLSKLPIIFYGHPQISETDILELMKDTRSHSAALLVTFSETPEELRALAKKIHSLYSFDLVIVSFQEMKDIVAEREARARFRHLVLSQIHLVKISPFVTTGPTPDDMFFGRERELSLLTEHARFKSYHIIGGRRVGKTSLLGRLHRVRLPAYGFRALYHDCATTLTTESFLRTLCSDWRPDPPRSRYGCIGELLRCYSDDKPLVLLLDEADRFVSADRRNGWQACNMLRAMSNMGRAQFVLSGERALRDAVSDPSSPLFNVTNEILLGPLDADAITELILAPMRRLEIQLVDAQAIALRIHKFASGHPNIVQRICQRLVNRLGETDLRLLSLHDVDAVINHPEFQEKDFLETYWERATPLEQIISLLMAQNPEPYRLQAVLDLLAKYRLYPEPEVTKAALDRLVDLRSILKRSQAGYEFAVTAFPEVIANTTTAEDLLIVLKSQYLKNPMELPE